jgi:hypothetical protein
MARRSSRPGNVTASGPHPISPSAVAAFNARTDERQSPTAAVIAARISESSTAQYRSVVAIALISASKQGAMLIANQRLRVPVQQTPEAAVEQDRGI